MIKGKGDFEDYIPENVISPDNKFYGLLWARPAILDYTHFTYSPYDEKDIEEFLKIVASDISIVGHTPVDGFYKIGKQLIVNSLSGAYLEIDFSKKYRTDDLNYAMKTVK